MKNIIKHIATRIPILKDLIKDRDQLRELKKFGHPGDFLSPIPDISDIEKNSDTLFQRDIDISSSIELRANEQIEFLNEIAPYNDAFDWPEFLDEDKRYYLSNGWFNEGDAIILYMMLRHFKPKRVIEIGSGYSSALMLDVNDIFLKGIVNFTFIEPFPEKRLLNLLTKKDTENTNIIKDYVQNVPISAFSTLESKDILFIDSSHVSKIGSDVNTILFDILPTLKPGVLVHFHDIFWPFQYPKEWIIDEGRAWNEAYLLRAFLQYNSKFEILFFNSYMGYKYNLELKNLIPLFLKNPGGSLWLRKM